MSFTNKVVLQLSPRDSEWKPQIPLSTLDFKLKSNLAPEKPTKINLQVIYQDLTV